MTHTAVNRLSRFLFQMTGALSPPGVIIFENRIPHKNSACSTVGGERIFKAMQHELRTQFHKKLQAQRSIYTIYKTIDKKGAF